MIFGIDRSALAELRSAADGFEAELLSALRAKTIDFTGDFKILSLSLTDHFTHFTAYPVETFLGANALFTTEDNSLGLSPFSSRHANLDGVCFEGLRYYRISLHHRQLTLA